VQRIRRTFATKGARDDHHSVWLIIPAKVVTMPPSSTASETLPSSVFESLLPKLLTILQVTQRPEGTSNVRNKQDLLQAVSCNCIDCDNDPLKCDTQIQAFREALNDARSIASALPGGEMLIEEQEDVIAMLERLRAKKRYVCCPDLS
jgi:hypothetical protein